MLILIMVANHLGYLPMQDFIVQRALAQADEPVFELETPVEENRNELGLIAILVENDLLANYSVRSRITTYADSVQQRIPHSKSFIIGIDEDESTFRIASILEKLYFEGIDTDEIDGLPGNSSPEKKDDNKLAGIVIIGDVPIPVVHEDNGLTSLSMYPYTDFYRKAYIYDHESDHFVRNTAVSAPTPEIWHGLIVPPGKDPAEARQQLIEYLEKNYEYTRGNLDYTDFEKRILYANFPEMERQMNYMDYRNYGRYVTYMEEDAMNRHNKHLLGEVIDEVSADMGSDTPIMDEATLNSFFDVQTKTIFDTYVYNFAQALKTYRSGINETIKKTGRWEPNEVDSPESLITIRDAYAKSFLKRQQLLLEKEVDDYITSNTTSSGRQEEIPTIARLRVKLKILDIQADNTLFNFYSYFDGQRATDIINASQCGMQVGQVRENQSVPENNSVLVEANRMYNPDTQLTNQDRDEDWNIEEDPTYELYGGCVFDNAYVIPQTGRTPEKCDPQKATAPVFDILGSHEIPAEERVNSAGRCDISEMIFKLQNTDQYSSVAAEGLVTPISFERSLTQVLNRAYSELGGGNPNADILTKGSYVVKELMESGEKLTYEAKSDVEIELSVSAVTKPIDTLYAHVEPTNETIRAIKRIDAPRTDPDTGAYQFPEIVTPSTPADGIRYISFARNSLRQVFEYLNLFRISGNNASEVTNALTAKFNQKQTQLDQATGTTGNLFNNYYAENSELIEPLIWKASGIDQKLAEIIPKYLDRNSFMPTPYYNPQKSPQNKPTGYEVLHIVAEGDETGYQFGLNRAMQIQAPDFEPAEKETGPMVGTGTGGPDIEAETESGGATEDEGNFLCGDPSGVEIWEWFDSLQCWINEEILPAAELFSLNSSCSSAPIPPEIEEPAEDPFDDVLLTATGFDVEMNRKSLVPDQTERIKISALDADGQPVLGYIDMPVTLTLSNPALGVFSTNNFYIYEGEREVEFTARETGSATVTVQMGNLPERTFIINVYDPIQIEWGAREEIVNGRSEFMISVRLRGGGNYITNVNATLPLAPQQPADGGFENGGQLQLVNGQGTIKFIPTPGRQEVVLISKDSDLGEQPFVIEPTTAPATQILLKSPKYIPIGTQGEIEVIAADAFGFPGKEFNEAISVELDEKSQEFASLTSPTVNMVNGRGVIRVNAGKESAEITLTANHEDLKFDRVTIPLLARVDSEKWKDGDGEDGSESFMQNLFASFVGFPAGDFTQKDYFGGTHLFNGKTEAVYSFLNAPIPAATLSIAPNHFITSTDQKQAIYASFSPNAILLQAFDRRSMQTLISQQTPLNLDAIEIYQSGTPETGKLYIDMLSNDFSATRIQNGYIIRDSSGEAIARLQTNSIWTGGDFEWNYVKDPEFDAIELKLSDGLATPARIILSLEPTDILPEDFLEINPGLSWKTIYGGNSIKDPTGLVFYPYDAEVPETIRAEFYGFEGTDRYLSSFASGTNAGNAVKYNMPLNAVLLGDPTISLPTRSTSSLNYNTASGEQIFADPEGKQIVSISHFNFNNDEYQDVALLTEDGRVRLLEGEATEPPYTDRGNLAFLTDGGVTLEAVNLERDNYEDLIAATAEGRLAILHNDHEVITRTDHQLNIGKMIYKILEGDMDQDGYGDLVVLDSRGDLYIFYYNPVNETYPENGLLIGNHGFSLRLDDNLNTDLDIRYAGIPEPSSPEEEAVEASGVTRPSLESGEISGSVPDNVAQDYIGRGYEANTNAGQNPGSLPEDNSVPKLPWPEGDELETYFAPAESIGNINIIKHVSNKDRPGQSNVDLEEYLSYTIEINPSANLNNVVLADTVPDSLSFEKDSVTCIEGSCDDIRVQQNGIKVFFSGFNLRVGQRMTISYDAFVAHTPQADIFIGKINEPNENLIPPESIIDDYLDVYASPPYNTTGKYMLHYSTGPRSYATVEDNDPEPSEELNEIGSTLNQMVTYDGQEFDEDNPPPPVEFSDEQINAIDQAMGNNDCLEDPQSATSCVESTLDSVVNAIQSFSCIGGGCFPMPFNRAFLVPPAFPLPAISFPVTLPTPVGPIPFVSFFGIPSVIGMASIPGPIMSAFRFYVSPTLTGGIGLAMCWGPYPQAPVVPPPVWPIPYPPPIGNCMVKALPVEDMFGGLCSSIRDNIIEPVMDAIRAGANRINSGVNDINNNPNLPINIDRTSPDGGAGGLEISLAVELGDSMRFNPPSQGFSNTHIPPFDSLGGVISGWFDRQTLEIQNKLLTLPTFSIYLPDFKSLFLVDADKFKKSLDAWKNVLSGSAAATSESIHQIADPDTTPEERERFERNVSGLGPSVRKLGDDLSGSNALKYMSAVEKQTSIYNLQSFEGIYDVASTLPIVKLTEKPIQFNIPWLSPADIQAWIIKAQNWVIYYEREYARVVDKWEAISCEDLPEATDAESMKRNRDNCIARQVADAFGVNFDPMINSVKENIEILRSYMLFPKLLVKFKQQLADYIRNVACYLNEIAMMMGGWLATIQQQMVSWAELILTIVEIINNIEDLFNLFTDFDENCDICTNERYANFGWWMLLGLVLPDIPIIQFPKIPDIVLDMSDMNMQLDIELPVINLRPLPIPLPPLPYIRLPDFPSISMLLTLPPLPILPRLPELPDLPDLPPLPTIDLPTLPAPPKLPDVGQAFEMIIPIIEKVLEIWCLMKKSFAPVPEQMLNDQITLLTNRPAYLIPLDLLDVQLPNIALFDLGFNELRIETLIYLGLRVNVVSRPLEEFSRDVNEWTQAIPDEMNQFYQEHIIATESLVQGWIDEAEDWMQDMADVISEGCIDYDYEARECRRTLQDVLDENLRDPLAEADEWLRDREASWQEFADEQAIDWSYEDYYRGIRNANEAVERWSNEATQDVQDWFAEHSDFITGLNYITFTPVFEYLGSKDFGNDMQEVLDLTGQQLNQALAIGPWNLPRLQACLAVWPYCREHQEEFFGNPAPEEANAESAPELPKENKQVAQTPTADTTLSEQEYAEKILETPQGQEIQNLLTQVVDEIKKINEREPVEYTALKKQFNIPDYVFAPRETTVDKLNLMSGQLVRHSDELLAEAEKISRTNDLTAIAGVPPLEDTPYKLTDTRLEATSGEERYYTNALPPEELPQGEDVVSQQIKELQQKIDSMYAQSSGKEAPTGGLGDSCDAAVCLPDTITGDPVPLIPTINSKHSETLFMPNGHIVYSDGTGLFLKRDLTIDDSDLNTDTGHPQRYSLDGIAEALWIAKEPKEAVNMLESTFNENGASTFNWAAGSHPDLYGYGIEIERTINGYDTNRQDNGLADIKVILLPPDEAGGTPEVLVDGKAIPYGTLITSLENEESAMEKFGVQPKNIRTGIRDVRFPTINNALIRVSDNKAVYFDQLNGSSYTMNMENGYYQIKMTWFDEYAGTATYNQNELIAPQIYSDAAAPIDISQTDTYYMPIFKEQTFRASRILLDLNDDYDYYWYIDPDNNQLTPQDGDTLTIPPQNEEKTIKVKLVATQGLQDDNFEPYEKIFNIKVYVPSISLDSNRLREGIIAGNMTPIPQALTDDLEDDLSGIPFSVFRKRLGTWKNIGILHSEDPDKEPTDPPLDENQNYYSIDSAGSYYIEGFDITENDSIVLSDQNGDAVARVEPGSGLIDLYDPDYERRAVPASTSSPTHIAIIRKEDNGILGNVYYISASGNNVTIENSGLNKNNVAPTGTTVGDMDPDDDIIAAVIPAQGPSFPGGVSIFEENAQKNVALVDKDGSIRMMQASYQLRLKNPGSTSEPYIFQIVTSGGKPVFDVFIQADFDNLQIDNTNDMNSLKVQIGLLGPGTAYAQSAPQMSTEIDTANDTAPVPQFDFEPEEPLQLDGNPFPDVDETHPYFNQILELYKNRIISGYEDGTFKPDQKVTRAEFVKIALGVTNCVDCTTPNDAIKEKYLTNPFPDVRLPAWFFYCISIAKELGMVTGYGDGFFRPDRNISRAEAAAVLLRQSGIELTEAPENAFVDVPEYAWYKDYVFTAVQIGLIRSNFSFVNPDEEITRGEFAFMAAGVKDLKACYDVDSDEDGVPDWYEMSHGMDIFKPDAEKLCPCSDNPWPADTDGDGIRDVCDLDIDNDGVLNPMCILNDRGEVDADLLRIGLAQFAQRGEPVDNCIFDSNPDQGDQDSDMTGNLCDADYVYVPELPEGIMEGQGSGETLTDEQLQTFCPCTDNPNANDSDEDGIRDVCDYDIDNDGILNPICIFDDSGLLDPEELPPDADNCPFVPNPQQGNADQDTYGDACQPTDICPSVPEDIDGVDDEDGCPELSDDFPEQDPGTFVTPGDLCSILDFESDMSESDIFITAITNLESHEVLFSQSPEVTFTPQ